MIGARFILGISRSFRVKLILSLSVIISLTFGITGYYTYLNNLNLFEQEISKQFSGTNHEALAKLDLKMQEIVRISQSIVFNPEIERLVSRIDQTKEDSEETYSLYYDRKQIEDQIFQIKSNAPYINGMYLYDLNGTPSYFRYTTSAINYLDGYVVNDIRYKMSDSYGDLVWMNMPLPSSIEPSGFRKSIVISRFMKNSSLKTYGILVMVIDESFFSSALKELIKEGMGKVYLFDPNNELLYSNASPESVEKLEQLGSLEQTKMMDNYLFVQGQSKESYFKLVSGTSLTEIRDKNRNQLEAILYSAIASILFTSILIILSTSRLLRPLKELLQGLRRVRAGDFDTQIKIRTKDELAYIGESFNEMTLQVGQLIKEVYLTQLSEREAELKALQAQLNPHFLHNMLNEIYWKLYLNNEKETASQIGAMSEMLKYSLMPVRTLTTVQEEIQQIKNYVKLQTELFESDLETVIEADEETMDCQIMRFILQPLVENVFMHAFRNKLSGKKLVIRACIVDGHLDIEVSDNGCGMNEASIASILGTKGIAPQHRSDGRESLGVRSVVRRIELVCGSPYYLDIKSKVDAGTTMRLVLPYIYLGTGDTKYADG